MQNMPRKKKEEGKLSRQQDYIAEYKQVKLAKILLDVCQEKDTGDKMETEYVKM